MGYLKVLVAGLVLAGCTDASRAIVNQAVETVKQVEDSKARLVLQAPCAMTVGAKNRVLSEDEKGHVEALCGGTAERPATVEDLQRLLAAPR